MKVACLGNMNNILFQIGRYLLDEGHDVTFFMFDESNHFLPEADSYESVSSYKIRALGWNFDRFVTISKKEILEKINGFDFYIGTDVAPAFMFKAGLRLDVFFPHGSDLYEFPFPYYRNKPPQLWEIPKYITGKAQSVGISETSVISLDPSEDVYEKPFAKLKTEKTIRISAPPFLYLSQYKNNFLQRSEKYNYFKELRSKYKFIVFQHGSQDWSDRGATKINKGNDVLINAFAEYLKSDNHFKTDSILALVEYGGDVEKSKKLIQQLEIESNVLWLPKMYRKDIMVAISMSDICVGELGYRNWFSYGCVFEFMAMKKPLIHYRNDKFYAAQGIELYAMIDTKEVEIVKDTFIDYRSNPEKYRKIGEQAFEWLQRRTQSSVHEFLQLMEKKKLGKTVGNKISNSFFRKLSYYSQPDIIYSYLFFYFNNFKKILKGKER